MGYSVDYLNIVDEIKGILLNEVPEFNSVEYSWVTPWFPVQNNLDEQPNQNKVVFGSAFEDLNLPQAFIVPDVDNIQHELFCEQEHHYNFKILIINEKTNKQEGLREDIQIAGTVYDKLMDYKDLNGKCDYFKITRILPETLPENLFRITMDIEVIKMRAG